MCHAGKALWGDSRGGSRSPGREWNSNIWNMESKGLLQDVFDRREFQELATRGCFGQAVEAVES